jgi:hypothetical protein
MPRCLGTLTFVVTHLFLVFVELNFARSAVSVCYIVSVIAPSV